MWPKYGVCGPFPGRPKPPIFLAGPASSDAEDRKFRVICAAPASSEGGIEQGEFLPSLVLTSAWVEAYIPAFGTPPPRCDGASSKLLTDIR